MDNRTCYCRNSKCVVHGHVAPRAHLKFRDWHRGVARFECRACEHLVSARTGTAYAGVRTDLSTYRRGAKALAEGMSIRATGRLLEVDKDTVNHWLPILGRHSRKVMNYTSSAICTCRNVSWTNCGHSLLRKKPLDTVGEAASNLRRCLGMDCFQPGLQTGASLGRR